MKRLYKQAAEIDLQMDDKRKKEEEDKKELDQKDDEKLDKKLDRTHEQEDDKDDMDDFDFDELDDEDFEEDELEDSKGLDIGKESLEDKINNDQMHDINLDKSNSPVENAGLGVNLERLEDALVNDLCSLQVLYQQVKFFHWMVKGKNYISTHRYLDEVSEGVLTTIDILAERLVYLNIEPTANMNEIVSKSYVNFSPMPKRFSFEYIVDVLDEGLSQVINKMIDNSIKASDKKDVGTSKLLEDFIHDLETLQHHIRSFLES